MHAKCALTALYGVLLLSGGCMHSPAEESSQPKPKYTEHHSVTGAKAPAPAQPRAPDSRDNMLDRMGQDLAQRLGVHVSAIQVLNVQQVTWSDSSLGCPQPGHSYLQAQTPGVRVVLGYQNQPYQYHGADSGNFLYCEHPAVSGLDEK